MTKLRKNEPVLLKEILPETMRRILRRKNRAKRRYHNGDDSPSQNEPVTESIQDQLK